MIYHALFLKLSYLGRATQGTLQGYYLQEDDEVVYFVRVEPEKLQKSTSRIGVLPFVAGPANPKASPGWNFIILICIYIFQPQTP